MKLIKNWKEVFLKSYSSLSNILGIVVMTLYTTLPSLDYLPQEIKESIPPEHLPYIAGVLFFCSIAGRMIPQKSLHKGEKDEKFSE